MNWDTLAGPAALAIAASVACVALWREHVKDDDRKDKTIEGLTVTVGAFPGALRDLTTVVLQAAERERTRPRNERADDR